MYSAVDGGFSSPSRGGTPLAGVRRAHVAEHGCWSSGPGIFRWPGCCDNEGSRRMLTPLASQFLRPTGLLWATSFAVSGQLRGRAQQKPKRSLRRRACLFQPRNGSVVQYEKVVGGSFPNFSTREAKRYVRCDLSLREITSKLPPHDRTPVELGLCNSLVSLAHVRDHWRRWIVHTSKDDHVSTELCISIRIWLMINNKNYFDSK